MAQPRAHQFDHSCLIFLLMVCNHVCHGTLNSANGSTSLRTKRQQEPCYCYPGAGCCGQGGCSCQGCGCNGRCGGCWGGGTSADNFARNWNNEHSCSWATQYLVSPATTQTFGTCAAISSCGSGQYVLSAATRTTDTRCGTYPTAVPTKSPTGHPTAHPTGQPTIRPTSSPTTTPTGSPTASPTVSPVASPTASPTPSPIAVPTASPTSSPMASPIPDPTVSPTASPIQAIESNTHTDAKPTSSITLDRGIVVGLALVLPIAIGVAYACGRRHATKGRHRRAEMTHPPQYSANMMYMNPIHSSVGAQVDYEEPQQHLPDGRIQLDAGMYVGSDIDIQASGQPSSSAYGVIRSPKSGDYLHVSGSKNEVIRQSREGIVYAVPMAAGSTVPHNYINAAATNGSNDSYASIIFRSSDSTVDTSTYDVVI